VTVLTGFSNQSLKKTGHTRSIKNLVIHQAKLAKSAGLDGIVCSAKEAKLIKKICKNMEIITPGIRLPGDNVQDQNKNRVMYPKSAFKNGATAIVIGRSITQGSIKNNLQKLIKSLN
jgi:orotidine-5'-phosphate decarboxylase